MTGVLDEATETWVDLDDMLAAELPPCELVQWHVWQAKPPPCGRPSVTVITLTCGPCGTRPRACCATHLRRLRRRQRMSNGIRFALERCGKCAAGLTIGGLS